MDVVEAHAERLPDADDRWVPAPYDREELLRATLAGRMAGVVSHPLDNVLWKIDRLCENDPDLQFGMTGLQRFTPGEVLELVCDASGWSPPAGARAGPFEVDAAHVLDACEAVGDRLEFACRKAERAILATGHPVGLMLLYQEVGRMLAERGVTLLRPIESESWKESTSHHKHQVRYLHGVAMLTDKASAKHTHSGVPMERMLAQARPDLVFADHGFAGAAIEAGVETISIADVNDPALVVAEALGRTETVVVMDDNVQPEDYWPCFQAIASRLP